MLNKKVVILAVATTTLLMMALAPAQADWDEANKSWSDGIATLTTGNLCLDVSKADKDTPATVAPCNGKNTQKFWIELVPGERDTGLAATKPVRFRLVNDTQPFLSNQCLGLKDPSGGVVVVVPCDVGSPFTDPESFDWVKPTAGLQGVNFVRGNNVLGLKGSDVSASPGAATGWDVTPYVVVSKIQAAGAASAETATPKTGAENATSTAATQNATQGGPSSAKPQNIRGRRLAV